MSLNFFRLGIAVTAGRLRESCQKSCADFESIAPTARIAVQKAQLGQGAGLWVAAKLRALLAGLEFENQALLVVFQVVERAVVVSENISSDQNFEGELGHNAELVPQEN